MHPALCLEREFVSVAGDEYTAQFRLCDVTYLLHSFEGFYLVVVGNGHCEEKFVVFTSVEGCCGEVHVHLFAHDGSLVVDRNAVFVYAATDGRLFADVKQFGGESVADIYHRCGSDVLSAETLNDVATCRRTHLTFDEVFLTGKVRLTHFGELLLKLFLHLRIGSGSEFFLQVFYLSVVYLFFAFEELKSHICCSEVATDTDDVGGLGTASPYGTTMFYGTYGCDADGKSGHAAGGVTTYYVNVVFLAGYAQSIVEVVEVFNSEPFADGKTDGYLFRCTSHGIDVAEVDYGTLVTEMTHGDVGEVEMDALHKQVGSDKQVGVVVATQYGTVVTDGEYGFGVLGFDIFRQSVDKTEFTKFGNVQLQFGVMN